MAIKQESDVNKEEAHREELWRDKGYIEFDSKLVNVLQQKPFPNGLYGYICTHFQRNYHRDLNILLCLVIHMSQVEFAEWIINNYGYNPNSYFHPLISAVCNRTGQEIEYLCKQKFHNFYLNARGYGVIMEKNKLIYDGKLSALEIVLRSDDLTKLKILTPHIRGELDALFEMARHYKAHKCMGGIEYTWCKEVYKLWPFCWLPPRLVTKWPRQIDTLFEGSPHGEGIIFSRLMDIMMMKNGRITELQQSSAVCLWLAIKNHLEPSEPSEFESMYITNIYYMVLYKLCHEGDKKRYNFYKRLTDFPLCDKEPYGLHGRLILDSFRMLLHAQKGWEAAETLTQILQMKFGFESCKEVSPKDVQEYYHGALTLLNSLIKLFSQYNPTPKRQNIVAK